MDDLKSTQSAIAPDMIAAAKILRAQMARAASEIANADDRVRAIVRCSNALVKLNDSAKKQSSSTFRGCVERFAGNEPDAAEREKAMHEADEEYADILWPEEKPEVPAVKPGDVVTIDGVKDCPELVVLDVLKDGAFCITKNLVGTSTFGEDANYAGPACELRRACESWLSRMAKNGLDLAQVKEREISLLSTGGVDYGTLEVQAAPLTFDEWRKYAKLCLIDGPCRWHWLATSAASYCINKETRSPSTNNTDCAWYVVTDGSLNYSSYVTGTGGVRPALILNSSLRLCPKQEG